ncbi:TniB family NTP-binding protein [Paenibacillus sp. R14(2021)]|uniref:TniB family NTP-binding protein n=1 Tax=Paenibacillus sp. R14(2021) TaxID=2859228 RepID=UPI001C615D52|nr:TniB family NTP-binding protein [Paenibacillus sp. R14(2021)]
MLEQKFSGIYSDVQKEAEKNEIHLSEYHFAYAHIAQDKFSITFYHNEFSDDSFYLNMSFESLNGKKASNEELKRRVEHVKKIIVHHPGYGELLEELEMMLVLSEGSVSPEGLYIYGPTGVGKSTVTEEFTARYPRELVKTNEGEYTHITVLHVRVPPKATPKMLASKILEVMGDPGHHKGTLTDLTSRIHYFVRELGIKMIILDEFQHLIDADTDHVLTTASNWVKTFTEEIKIAIVLCGMPESVSVFLSNPQLDRRYCNKVSLEPFKYGTLKEIIDFRTFLQKIDMELPFHSRSNIADPFLAKESRS